ncbi:DUF5808 domain-containing protein [Actinoplanes sp. N902-109]|uniref:DUF5808 domain-containing protein n=1 Tax=Actinoplanes sp. (strain N902-109) TaxID=649831 RepID=UPI000329534D|nr:DUF5808 domain-containing protein [Actinoplanes sp. N902-109]AGL18678.1 hypothetical protein L083_5168 [Actinoplanes sp. N902-109]
MKRIAPPGGLTWSGLAQPLTVLVVTAAVGAWRYPHLPPSTVLHFDTGGTPDWTVPTSPAVAFLPVYGQLVVTVISIAAAVRARRPRAAPALLTLGMCVNIAFALLAVQQWWGGDRLRWPLLVGALTATILGAGLTLVTAARAGAAAPGGSDDDRYWRNDLFYSNPDDPNVLVPKRIGIGLTFNFGHPMAKVWLAVLVALPAVSIVLAALLGG